MRDGALLFRTRPHPIVLVGYLLLVLIFSIALRLISPPVSPILGVLLPAFVLGVLLLDYFGTMYEATTAAVRTRQGVVWQREESIPLAEIQDLKFSTGILGLLLGYGKLEIESAGTEGKLVLDALPTAAYRVLRPLRRSVEARR